jgi:hypothetical protein
VTYRNTDFLLTERDVLFVSGYGHREITDEEKRKILQGLTKKRTNILKRGSNDRIRGHSELEEIHRIGEIE